MNSGLRRTILLVEDEAIIAIAQKIALEKYGYRVVTANSGEKALELFNVNHDINLILMDIDLGKGLDGPCTATLILKKREIPVVFLSSHTEPEVVEKTEKITSYGYVVKNSGITVLDASIKMAFKLFEAKEKINIHSSRNDAIVEALPDHMFILDNNAVYREVYIADDASLPVSKEDILGKSVTELFMEDAAAKLISAFNACFESGDLQVCETELNVNGCKLIYESRLSRLDRYSILALVRNITGRGQAEADIKAKNAELEALNEELNAVVEEMQASNEELIQTQCELIEYGKALDESERKYREIFNNSIAGIFRTTADGKLTDANRSFAEIFGYESPENIIDKVIDIGNQLYAYPEDREELKKRILEQNRVTNFEVEARTCQGQQIWVSINASAVRDDSGSIKNISGTIIDITANRQDRELLIENEKKYRRIFENVQDVFYQTDINGFVTEISPSAEKYSGYSRDELIGKPVESMYYNSADRGNILKIIMEQGEVSDYELRLKAKDGTLITASLSSHILYDITGEPMGLEGALRDITERKQSEKLLHTRMKYEMALSSCSRELINLSDPEKSIENNLNHLLNFTELSRVYIIRNAYNQAGDLCMQLTHEACSPGVNPVMGNPEIGNIQYKDGFSRWEKLLSNGMHVTGVADDFPMEERAMMHSRGIITILMIPVFVNSVWYGFLGFDDTERGFVWDNNDIFILTTAAEMLGIYIERIRKEKSIIDLLGEKELILKEVHHRIKNNMNTIRGLLFLQSDTASNPSTVAALEDAGSRVQSMMLLYDKLYQSVDFEKISVADYLPALVQEIVANFPHGSRIRLIQNIDDFMLNVKRLQPLGIIINELLTNIMKYAFTGRDDGQIEVTATVVGANAVFIIRDNGGGIPESIDFKNTTGFGLMLVEMLVFQLNGTIEIERGEGTKFIIQFELQQMEVVKSG